VPLAVAGLFTRRRWVRPATLAMLADQRLVEQEVHVTTTVRGEASRDLLWGTADFIAVSSDRIDVVDLKFGGMDASLMARMKELEEENRRLRKMYIEEKLKAEVVAEALAKSGEAISQTRDG
jgi:hypothetical protein